MKLTVCGARVVFANESDLLVMSAVGCPEKRDGAV